MTMFICFIIIVVLFEVFITYLFKSKESDNKSNKLTYFPYKKTYLLSKTEYTFYNNLVEICNANNLLICPKVRLEDFIEVTDNKNKFKYRNYIKSRHVDFLICDNLLRIKFAIELDDKSHNSKSAQQTDEFKDKLFDQIGIKLYRIKVGKEYTTQLNEIIKNL